MKIHEVLGSLGVIGLLLCLSSCDPWIEHEKVIINGSDYDITIYIEPYPHENMYLGDSIFLPRNKETVIAQTGRIGNASEFDNCPTEAHSITARVNDNDSLALQLNINDPYYWSFDRINAGKCECTLTITNGDIH